MANRNEPGYLGKFIRDYPLSSWLPSLDEGRVLNIGSKNYGHNIFYDQILQGKEILGVDMVEGDRVDVVCNMEGDCKELNGEKFSIIICASVLEHCERPWIVADNIQNHLMPSGLLYVTVPWVWRTHNYPKDYWRMSPDAVRVLFPLVKWKRVAHGTHNENEFINEGADHDNQPPWRVVFRGRVHIAVQAVHMIGRML